MMRGNARSSPPGRDSPFARPATTATHRGPDDASMEHFRKLKPTCVQLLGLANPPGLRSPLLVTLLSSLRTTLDSITSDSSTRPHSPLSSALINYVFFPLAQLLRTPPTGAAGLPSRVREEVFGCLACLARDWWLTFEKPGDAPKQPTSAPSVGQDTSPWRVWEQLLMLGAVALGGPPRPDSKQAPAAPASPSTTAATESDEVRLAIVSFLAELLKPRERAEVQNEGEIKAEQPEPAEWEWDGESELPSLDDLEIEEEKAKARKKEAKAAKKEKQQRGSPQQSVALRYPNAAHLALADRNQASRGALSHALTTALSIATEAPPHHSTSTSLRLASFKLGRLILTTWLAAHGEGLQRRADRSAVFLPGFASTCVRVVLNQARGGKDSGVGQGPANEGLAGRKDALAPGPLAAEAISGLAEVLKATISDEASLALLDGAGSEREGDSQGGTQAAPQDRAPASLEELVERAKTMDLGGEHKPSSSQQRSGPPHPASSKPASTDAAGSLGRTRTWLEHTLAQIHVSLTSIAPASGHSSSAVQSAVVDLSKALLSECGRTLAWGDGIEGRADIFKGRGEEDLTSDSVQLLLRMLCDVAAGSHSSASSARRARDVLRAFTADDAEQGTSSNVKDAIAHELSSCVRQLPRSVLAQHEDLVIKLSRRFAELARLSATSSTVRRDVQGLVGRGSRPQAWAHRLLEALEVSTEELARFESSQDELGAGSKALPLKHVGAEAGKAVSLLLRSLGFAMAQSAIKGDVEGGSASTSSKGSRGSSSLSKEPFFLLHFLLDVAREMRADAWSAPSGGGTAELLARRSTAAFMLVDELLRGVVEVISDDTTKMWTGREGRKARKVARRLADEVTKAALEIWDADAAEKEELLDLGASEAAAGSAQSARQALLRQADAQPSQSTVFQRGLAGEEMSGGGANTQSLELGPAIDTSHVSSALISDSGKRRESSSGVLLRSQKSAVAHLKAGDAFLLSMLGSSSLLEGPGFSKHLLRALYLVVSGASSQDVSIREAAGRALDLIATSTGHGDVRQMVLGHLDYLLGAASHRLISGLGEELERLTLLEKLAGRSDTPETALVLRRAQPLTSSLGAPLVLVEIIRMLGSDAVPLVQDAVDEVLEAIDRFHGHEEICDGLLNVVDSIVGIMAQEERGRAQKRRIEGEVPHGKERWAGSYKDKEWSILKTWLKVRKGEASADDPSPYDGIAPSSPPRAAKGVEQAEPNAPSASQASVAAMLKKGVPFLSHPSPIIRARMLRLLRSGVEVLASQGRESDVVPVVLSAWPFVLARLGRSASIGGDPSPASRHSGSFLDPASVRPDRLSASEATKRLSKLSETEPFVWLEAASLVSVLAELLPDFFGRKIQEEAWSRVDEVLRIAVALEGLEGVGDGKRQVGRTYRLTDAPKVSSSEKEQAKMRPAFKSHHPHSLVTKLLTSTLRALASLLAHHGTAIQERWAWGVVTHPDLLGAMDERQPETLRVAAREMYAAAGRRNKDALWALLGARERDGDGPEGGDEKVLRLPSFDIVIR